MSARPGLWTALLIALVLLALPRPSSGQEGSNLTERYRAEAGRILGAALVSDRGYETLALLCDHFGHRLSGSPQLEEAIAWCAARMREDGLENVHLEKVMVPVWVRGQESAWLSEPRRHDLSILGLGRSVGTPPGGLEADVVVARDFDALAALGEERVRGNIVLFDAPFQGYGRTVGYRSRGPSEAAKLGAVGCFVQSIGPMSYDTPHTGALHYSADAPQIPAAAVTIENAAMMRRMFDRGDRIRAHLQMEAQTLPDAESANLVAEIVGSELPEEIVVVGGHIDSWDVGQGAQDDGAGCVMAWEVVRLLHELDMRPRRTIRVVLFTNEENGLAGGRTYAEDHLDELPLHVAAIEADSGNGPAHGFRFQAPPSRYDPVSQSVVEISEEVRAAINERAMGILREISVLLEPLGASGLRAAGSGADLKHSVERGMPGLGLDQDVSGYFEIHHTKADTFEKIVKLDLQKNTAIMAIMAYVLADMPGRLLEPEALAPPTR